MGIQLDGINNEIKSQTKIDFPGSVGVAGTLTYEDVTNVDSIGIITGRNNIDAQKQVLVGTGVSVKTGGINVTAGITTVQALQATTGTFSSDVSAATLTSTGNVTLPDSIIHTGDTDTKIRFPEDNKISFETAGTERLRIDNIGVLYTGNYTTTLDATPGSIQMSGGTSGARLSLRGSATGAGNGLAEIFAYWDTNKVAGMIAFAGEDTTNKDDGKLNFYTADGSGVQARMRISKEGYVTKPNQPSFHVTIGGGQINSNVGTIVFTDASTHVNHNTGSHYNTSNGRFTAPIAGKYLITARMLTNSSTNNYTIYLIRRNGTTIGYIGHNHTDSWFMESGTWVMNLNANDYIDCYLQAHSGHGGYNYASFSGFLIG